MNKINAYIFSFIEFLHKSVTFIEAFRRLKAAFILDISVETKTSGSQYEIIFAGFPLLIITNIGGLQASA